MAIQPLHVPQEQFRNARMVVRNRHLVVALQPLFLMRSELTGNDEFIHRGGTDTPTRDHLLNHLVRCDLMRRKVTHNPAKVDLDVLKLDAADEAKVKDAANAGALDSKTNPFGGDQIQNQSGGLIDLSLLYALDGSDMNIRLNSGMDPQFRTSPGGIVMMGIDDAIVTWTRLNSATRSSHITIEDSIRVLGKYQAIYDYLRSFTGDENRVDVAQLLPTEEPRGPQASPNLAIEDTGAVAPA